jgi:chromosome segregation ATPase
VNRAADEIERLRAENRRLQERVETLEQRPDVSQDEAFITLDDPEALRRQIQDFIDTIDAYLDEPTPEPDDAE